MGVCGTSAEENHAFISMSCHFRNLGLLVPKVLSVSEDGICYLQEDLGDNNLFSLLSESRKTGVYSEQDRFLLVQTIRKLPEIQVLGARDFDFNNCYSEKEFGERQIMFDLNYFKYCFLKATGIEFNESFLEDDFIKLKDDLCKVSSIGFLYRDFQSRNVMIVDGKPYFIDFQGGQRGPHHYDVASFVWQAKAVYPSDLKEELVSAYLDSLSRFEDVDKVAFRKDLRHFVLFRTLQVLGCYGFRGLFEKKAQFIESIPFAMDNLREILQNPFVEYPYLTCVLNNILLWWQDKGADSLSSPKIMDSDLLVQISSFSYKVGIPEDDSKNGGGYVFDCRSIHNPGRYEEYKKLTGMDKPVIDFLESQTEILQFLEHVYGLIDPHVETFIRRGFNHLQVSFGCTGGQHRSVYCAESLARHLNDKYGVKVQLRHIEQKVDKFLDCKRLSK